MKEQLPDKKAEPEVEAPLVSETVAQDQKPEKMQNDRKLLKPKRPRSGGYLNSWRS
jgi:hypothetical protein